MGEVVSQLLWRGWCPEGMVSDLEYIVKSIYTAIAQGYHFGASEAVTKNPCNQRRELWIVSQHLSSTILLRLEDRSGWPAVVPEFDPEYAIIAWDVCQLVPGTVDGFPNIESQIHPEIGPDPPRQDYPDPPHLEDNMEPPSWKD